MQPEDALHVAVFGLVEHEHASESKLVVALQDPDAVHHEQDEYWLDPHFVDDVASPQLAHDSPVVLHLLSNEHHEHSSSLLLLLLLSMHVSFEVNWPHVHPELWSVQNPAPDTLELSLPPDDDPEEEDRHHLQKVEEQFEARSA